MNTRRSAAGFSLIELMVVLFVMALAIGMATFQGFRFDADSELQNFGEEVYAQLQFGTDQALFGGEHLGLVPEVFNTASNEQAWQLTWHRWRDGEWSPVTELPPIKPPDFIKLGIEIDEQPVDLWRWLEFDKPLPVIIFYGGGEALAATLILELDSQSAQSVRDLERRYVHMQINEMGRITWLERSQEAERQLGKL
ncbi:prepilin-type N-terminal cleavage/methylation domain-containing protein [Halioxenophilus sp. WMMB6]|uniref:prepilin-type N-terminal cleavage/methylation domain-containing protein n=1 Tax=Halioxenophilus sp. WMMB6 TaxID=3073815 RepID=UPI00295E344F|nr:prepilin-type N-terminal cleavage/methylation domain-containing protein [Halioxenophilus sp. WMMB6]